MRRFFKYSIVSCIVLLLMIVTTGLLVPRQISGENSSSLTVTSPTEGETLTGTVYVMGYAPSGELYYMEVSVDGGDWETADPLAMDYSQWMFTLDTTYYPDGKHIITVGCYEATNAGGVIVATKAINVTFENGVSSGSETGEDIAILTPTDQQVVAGTITVGGTANTNDLIYVYIAIDGELKGTITGTAYWACKWDTTNYVDGKHTISVVASDLYGESYTSVVSVTVYVANTKPTVEITTPTSGQYVSGNVSVSGTASEGILWVEASLDSGEWATINGNTTWNFTLDTTTGSDGAHTISIKASNGFQYSDVQTITVMVKNKQEQTPQQPSSGVESQSQTQSNKKPTITILMPTNNNQVAGTVYVAGTANDDKKVMEVQIRIDDGNWILVSGENYWRYDWDSKNVKNGQHTISARAFDGFLYSDIWATTVDVVNTGTTPSKPPVINIDTPQPGARVSGNITISGTTSFDITDLQIRIDSEQWDSVTTLNNGNWTYNWNTERAGNGKHNIFAKASNDKLSNETYIVVYVNNTKNVSVQIISDFTISSSSTPIFVNPGGIIRYKTIITNNKPIGDTIVLDVYPSLIDWEILLMDEDGNQIDRVNVEAVGDKNSAREVVLYVVAPVNVAVGTTCRVFLVAVGSYNLSQKTVTIPITTTSAPLYNISFTTQDGKISGTAGENMRCEIVLENYAVEDDIVDFSTTQPEDWGIIIKDINGLQINSGQLKRSRYGGPSTTKFSVIVDIPKDTIASDYNVSISAISRGDSNITSNTALTISVIPLVPKGKIAISSQGVVFFNNGGKPLITVPKEGDEIWIKATIKNIGDANISNANIHVRVYLDTQNATNLINDIYLTTIRMNNSENITIKWKAMSGAHTIYVVIDDDGSNLTSKDYSAYSMIYVAKAETREPQTSISGFETVAIVAVFIVSQILIRKRMRL